MNFEDKKNSLKVLIIDDEDTIAKMIADVLESKVSDVIISSSGAEGLYRAREFEPDVIVLDLNMPGMDGFEVMNKLRKNQKTADIPVLIITVDDTAKNKKKGIELGAEKFLSKPFSINALEKAVCSYAL